MKNKSLKAALLVLATFASLVNYAQQVSYKILEDNPDKNNVFCAFNLLDFNAYLANMSVGVNFYGNATINKKIRLDLDIRKAWSDMGEGVFAPKDLTKSFHIMAGGQFYLTNNLKKTNVKVVLSSSSYTSGNKKYTSTNYLMVPGSKRQIIAVRGGLQYFHNNCESSNGTDPSEKIKAKMNGTVDYLKDPINYETVNYTVTTIGVYAGLSYRNIVNLIIKPEGMSQKGNNSVNDFYADLMFSPFINYNVKPNGKQAFLKDADLNISENSKNYLGWRIGWQAFLGKKVLFTTKMEIGQQPGNGNGAFFANIGLGIGLGTNVAKLKN